MISRHSMFKFVQLAVFYGIIGLILVYVLFPFYWTVNSSFKNEQEIIGPATFIPKEPTLDNYRAVFDNDQFVRGLWNSTIVSSITVIESLMIGSFAAYALGRLRFRGRTLMLYLILSFTMFPQISILSGVFETIKQFGIFGTIWALTLTYPLVTLPFTVWVLHSFFRGLPPELEQAAYVDGASPIQVFYKILLPLTAPALVATGLLAFIFAWNEYLFALTFTTINPDSRTVTVAVALFSGKFDRQDPIAEVMAAAVVTTIPLVVLVLAFQNRIIAGLTAGAVKS